MKIENVPNVFRPQYMYNAKQEFQNCSSLIKSVKEKFRFRDGLVWIVGLTVEITEAAFSNFSRIFVKCS